MKRKKQTLFIRKDAEIEDWLSDEDLNDVLEEAKENDEE
jgi:hypothetical protein